MVIMYTSEYIKLLGVDMADNTFFIRTSDPEAGEMLRKMAELDMRSIGNEVAWLIRQEYARRYSQPNANITIAEAEAAAAGK
jgi:hypothetical protein